MGYVQICLGSGFEALNSHGFESLVWYHIWQKSKIKEKGGKKLPHFAVFLMLVCAEMLEKGICRS